MKLIKHAPNLGYLNTMLWVPKKLLNVDGVKRALEFELTDRDSIRVLRLWEEAEHHLIVPRAFWKPGELAFDCIDCRPTSYERTGVTSRVKLDYKPSPVDGKLKPTGDTVQADAIEALIEANGGVLQLACGKGKTVVALHLASLLQVPTVIIVDNTHLAVQWRKEIAQHLNVPGGVGLIQGDTKDWRKSIVMATYQSLANWAHTMPEEVRRWFGLIIWDEGHHVSAPTFSKSAPLFYGYRLSLTATPFRKDGTHVIAQYHIGEVLFKDLIQKSPPKIYFKWTGYELDFDDPKTMNEVCDKNGEVHLGKLAGHFGANRYRMNEVVLPEVKALADGGHKVIVLSNSVDEVINLHTLWTTGDRNAFLYTDIPYPTKEEVGETLDPIEFSPDQLARAKRFVADIEKNLQNNPNMPKAKREVAEDRLQKYQELLVQHEVWKKTEKEMRRRQRAFLKDLLAKKSTSGLFTEAVEPEARFEMLRTRQVIFAIMKYGREGLDDKKLSAVLVSEPISDRNTLQQIMGRPRDKSNSVLIFLEDNVGPLIGQCRKLRHHLRDWPVNEGGPFKYEQINHPSLTRRQGSTWNAQKSLLKKPGLRVAGT
jgi:superfamily II DNA or RNA helicase